MRAPVALESLAATRQLVKDNPWAKITGNNSAAYYRRKSKQALRDYKKVQIQLENLETSVRDRCKKEFTGQSQNSYISAGSGKFEESH